MRFNRLTWIILGLGLAVNSAYALDPNGNGNRNGIQALYLFQETSGQVMDVSGVGTPLNLDFVLDPADNAANVYERTSSGLYIKSRMGLRSASPATKIIQACSASNEITIEAWILNQLEEPVDRPTPLKIVALGRRVNNTHQHNFFLGQDYDAAAIYAASLRTTGGNQLTESANVRGKLFFSGMPLSQRTPYQHVVYTKDRNNVARLWLGTKDPTNQDPNGVLILESERTLTNGNISAWATDTRLTIGNETNFLDFPMYNSSGAVTAEQKFWTGHLRLIAVYCRALTPTDLLGSSAPGTDTLPSFPIDPNDVITPDRQKAQLLYKRIVGINTPVDNPVLKEMETMIRADNMIGAALRATQEDNFVNITVRDMAARMSTRDNTVNTPLNDMVATIIGVARDNVDARQLLTGNFLYRGDPTKASVPYNEINDFLRSNNHYEALERGRFNLSRVLMRQDGQRLYNGSTNSIVTNPDPAGVITSRAFMAAHAIAGTNRRLVEFSFKEFMCIPINQWADISGTDTYVGRDVDRAPGGDHNKYKTTCRSCHSVMDSFRGAFAKVDFSSNYLKHADVMYGLNPPNGASNDDPEFMEQSPLGIAQKMNRNADTFSGGYRVETTEWINNANRGLNAEFFGWPAPPSGSTTQRGSGIKSFAELISQSKAFPRCMALRAYRSVCKRDATGSEQAMISRVADEFVQANYNLKELFARIAVTPECIGQ